MVAPYTFKSAAEDEKDQLAKRLKELHDKDELKLIIAWGSLDYWLLTFTYSLVTLGYSLVSLLNDHFL